MLLFVKLSVSAGVLFLLSSVPALAYDSHLAHRQLATQSLVLWQENRQALVSAEEVRWLADGAEEEDYPALRCLNHFYQPSTERPLVIRGLWLGHSALQWSAESKWQASGWGGDFAWPSGVEALRRDDRRAAWLTLGHNLHLLADLASPAHVHNDDHAEGDGYENYVKQQLKNGRLKVADLPIKTGVNCKTASECLAAMAEYTERYALSKDWSAIRDLPFGAREDQSGKFYLEGRLLGKREAVSEYLTLDEEVYEAYWQDLAPLVVAYGQRMIDLYWQEAGREPEKLKISQSKDEIKIQEKPAPLRIRIPNVVIVEIKKPDLLLTKKVIETEQEKSNSNENPEWPIVDESVGVPLEYLRKDWWPMVINGGALPASAASLADADDQIIKDQEPEAPAPVETPAQPPIIEEEAEVEVLVPVQPGSGAAGNSPTPTETPVPVEEKPHPAPAKINFFNLPVEYSGPINIVWMASPSAQWRYDLMIAYDDEPAQKVIDRQVVTFYAFEPTQNHQILKLSVSAVNLEGIKVSTSTQLYYVSAD